MAERLVAVTFRPSGKTLTVPEGTNLLSLMTQIGLAPPDTCAGTGKCGKCRVKIEAGAERLPAPSELELMHLTNQEISRGYRLACAVPIPSAASFGIRTVSIGRDRPKLQTEGVPVTMRPDPAVLKYVIRLAGQATPYEETMLRLMKKQHGLDCTMDYEALRMLPAAMKSGRGIVTCAVYDGKTVMAVERGDTSAQCLGIAADIGTTKLAVYLIDLNTGKELSSSAARNPQAAYGDDVMSRIAFSMARRRNTLVLQKALLREVAALITDCCAKAGAKPRSIYEACFVGNTCMVHLFLGVSPRSLAFFPYTSVFDRGVTLMAKDLPVPLRMNRAARVFTLPFIAGFVGADTVAAMLAVENARPGGAEMLVDIGTNTEIVLSDKNGAVACSCASGPAFEGMHITHGRKAESASIDWVSVDPRTFEAAFRTIDGERPAGICGSGIASAVAEMLKAGIIGPNGRIKGELAGKTDRIKEEGKNSFAFVLAGKNETRTGADITISQKDIVEVQKAKAAVYAGCTLLMRRKGVKPGRVRKLIVAGAFGRYVDKASVMAIGMLPEVPLNRIREVGNAAAAGAKMALISRTERLKAERIARSTEYYELAMDKDFTGNYAAAMLFPKQP